MTTPSDVDWEGLKRHSSECLHDLPKHTQRGDGRAYNRCWSLLILDPTPFPLNLPIDFAEGRNTEPEDRQLDVLGHFTLFQVKISSRFLDPTLNPVEVKQELK